jgi:hypothetical protein
LKAKSREKKLYLKKPVGIFLLNFFFLMFQNARQYTVKTGGKFDRNKKFINDFSAEKITAEDFLYYIKILA